MSGHNVLEEFLQGLEDVDPEKLLQDAEIEARESASYFKES